MFNHHETDYTVEFEFWNNRDDYRTGMRFDSAKLANDVYLEDRHMSDNCEVKQREVNYKVLYGKDGDTQ